MTATTFIAETETGIVSRSSSTKTYAFAILAKESRTGVFDGDRTADGTAIYVDDTRPEGAWGWSGDRTNAEKAANQARKVYRSVRVVPALRIAKTSPEFCSGMPDLAWHVVNGAGEVVRYGRTKAELSA